MSEQLAKQIQRVNDELDSKREAITRARARKPRKVRSRPSSPGTIHQSASATDKKTTPPSHSSSEDELKLVECDQLPMLPGEKELGRVTPHSALGKRMSIQLPVSEVDFIRSSSRRSHVTVKEDNNEQTHG